MVLTGRRRTFLRVRRQRRGRDATDPALTLISTVTVMSVYLVSLYDSALDTLLFTRYFAIKKSVGAGTPPRDARARRRDWRRSPSAAPGRERSILKRARARRAARTAGRWRDRTASRREDMDVDMLNVWWRESTRQQKSAYAHDTKISHEPPSQYPWETRRSAFEAFEL